MKEDMRKYENVDQYIMDFPPEVRRTLDELRRTVLEVAPDAKEVISYGMPTFKLNGILVHFAAFSDHIGLYPWPSGVEAFRERISPYSTGKGTIRFPLNQPVPYDLVREIVAFRKEENERKKRRKS